MGDDWFNRNAWAEFLAVAIIGILATIVRLASDPPRSVARMAWMLSAGLGLSTGGWLMSKSVGLDGYAAFFTAWVIGVMGSEATLPLVRRLLEAKLNIPPQPPKTPPQT